MAPEAIGLIAIISLFVLLAFRLPIAIVLGFTGLLGYIAVAGMGPGLRIAALIPFSKIATYSFSVIPLFVLMGFFAHHAGLTASLFDAGRLWLGRIKGGLVHATIVGCAAFGAVCGGGVATASVIGLMAIPQMERMGVQRKLAFGVVAAAGTIAQMIPPSIIMVIYGIITEVSIGRLLIAGFIPGIVAAINYMIAVYIRVRRNPSLVPPLEERPTFKQKVWGSRGTLGIGVIFIIVMGGIYTGIFTPTEAGGIGALATFVMAVGGRKLGWAQLNTCLYDSVRRLGIIILIVGNAFIFGYLLSITGLSTTVSEFLVGLPVPTIVIVLGILLMYLILGFFLDMIAAMFITLPFLLPALIALDVNLIWFGVLIVHMCEVALITPPFGLNLFTLKSLFPEVPFNDIVSGIWPFFMVDMITLAMYIGIPQLALFLPNLMMGD